MISPEDDASEERSIAEASSISMGMIRGLTEAVLAMDHGFCAGLTVGTAGQATADMMKSLPIEC